MAPVMQLESVKAGDRILVGGDGFVEIDENLAKTFKKGDSVLVVESTGELLLLPAEERKITADTVGEAQSAFRKMNSISDEQISKFFEQFAANLESDAIWNEVIAANNEDVEVAKKKGRSTTRLVANEKMRQGMISGLRGWITASSKRGAIIETVKHEGWSVDMVGAALGTVGFVFEGRPNVLADATGVLRGGNTVVFRIGSDALGTARKIMSAALRPALEEAGLPKGAVGLIDSAARSTGYALVSDRRLALAVARGSGPAVATLGALAQQAGVPASLHGTGGAWMYGSAHCNLSSFESAVECSLDRKVCNTLNVCCINRSRAAELVPAALRGIEKAARRDGQGEGIYKLHVVAGDEQCVPQDLLEKVVMVKRADGEHQEKQAEVLPEEQMGVEWEWEETQEMTLKIVDDEEHAAQLFNKYSPQFVACCISDDKEEHERFYSLVNAPFVGNGFTRWVDGQYALNRPELGLANWESGRLFGRAGVLSGDAVFTVRARSYVTNPGLKR
mmetsp:Transcript_52307/g.111377  ORF Transcript_52307/g.111377 Transcript_52307/m.111377 type:complete len:506 (+) Transcript_52307:92-1609(+)